MIVIPPFLHSYLRASFFLSFVVIFLTSPFLPLLHGASKTTSVYVTSELKNGVVFEWGTGEFLPLWLFLPTRLLETSLPPGELSLPVFSPIQCDPPLPLHFINRHHPAFGLSIRGNPDLNLIKMN